MHMLTITITYLTITRCLGISLLVVIDKEINCRTLALFPALANNIGFFAIDIISTFILLSSEIIISITITIVREILGAEVLLGTEGDVRVMIGW